MGEHYQRGPREHGCRRLRLEPPATKPRDILDSMITKLPDPERITRIDQTRGRGRSQVWHHGVLTSRTTLFWGVTYVGAAQAPSGKGDGRRRSGMVAKFLRA